MLDIQETNPRQASANVATLLVRYGMMGEVAYFTAGDDLPELLAGTAVVAKTSRGEEWGTVVAAPSRGPAETEHLPSILRVATADDAARSAELRDRAHAEFDAWRERIAVWNLALELIDSERTLDGEKLILYVLNDRGPETTQLALRAAAAGYGVIEVQPVGPEGVIPMQAKGGCGSGGCRH